MRLMLERGKFKYSSLIFLLFLLAIVVLSAILASDSLPPVWSTIVSGLITGLIVAVVQLVIAWRELQKMDKYDSLGIIEILDKRNDKKYYAEMIKNAVTTIQMIGVTAERFLHDFANLDGDRQDQVLLDALKRGVKVRILVAESECLENEKNKKKAAIAKTELQRLNESYPTFQFAYYKHLPTHGIFTIDNQSIVGPIFPDVPSEFTPAIHLKNDSNYGKKYLEYFNKEWKEWSQEKEFQ